jgi:hypothetical protein
MDYHEVREAITQKIVESGVSQEEAEHAVRQCVIAMAKGGGVAGMAGMAFGFFMTKNLAAATVIGAAGIPAGGAFQLLKAPQCQEVRDAINFWNTAKI